MKQKRVLSFGLALVMALGLLPVQAVPAYASVGSTSGSSNAGSAAVAAALTAARAATSSTTTGGEAVSLMFSTGDAKSATIIVGNNIGIQETRPEGFVSTGKFSVVSASTHNEISGGVDIPEPYEKIYVNELFNPETGALTTDYDESLSKQDIFHINGNYYALQAEGEAEERSDYGGEWGTTIISTTERAVTQYSACTIECVEAETSTRPPKFNVIGGAMKEDGSIEPNASGVFAGYTEVLVDDVTKDATKQKELSFHIGSGNSRIDFVMYPKSTYDYHTVGEGTDNDEGEPDMRYGLTDPAEPALTQAAKKDADNYVRKGTRFTLIFRMPTSNTLFLTVMTAQYAMELIEGQIKGSDGEADKSFIQLTSGDSLEYLTKSFQLRTRSSQYNANFRVEWEWVPDSIQMVDGVEKALADMTEGVRKQYYDAIQPQTANLDWNEATVWPVEDDITGKLYATVSYSKPGGGTQESKTQTLVYKDIVIHGTGKPVEVTQYKQTIGQEPEEYFGTADSDEDTTLPGRKTMDAYKGDIDKALYNKDPVGPHEYVLHLNMGAKNGAAKYAEITVNGNQDEAIVLKTKTEADAQPVIYTGGQIANPKFGQTESKDAGMVELTIVAQGLPANVNDATVTLDIRFYLPGRTAGEMVVSEVKPTIILDVVDNTPSQDSTLASLKILDQDGDEVVYDFDPNTKVYNDNNGKTIHLPYKASEITLTPTLNDSRGALSPIVITRFDATGSQVGDPITVMNGNATTPIPFPIEELGQVTTIQIVTPSQDPRTEYWSTYKLDVVRDRPSSDNTLKSLGIYYEDDDKLAKNIIQNFDPDTLEYTILIPYSTPRLRVRAEANHERAEGPVISPELVGANVSDLNKQWLEGLKDMFKDETLVVNGAVDLTFTITAEDGTVKVYTVHIHRADPNDDATLKGLKVTNTDDENIAYEPRAVKADVLTYRAEVPYVTDKVKVTITPTDSNVSNIQIYSLTVEPDNMIYSMADGNLKIDVSTPGIPVLHIGDDKIEQIGYHTLYIVITAEDEKTTQTYELRVVRSEPSEDASLKALILKDQDGVDIKTFAFHPEELGYSLDVPYETNAISFTPTANYPGAQVHIREDDQGAMLPHHVPGGMTSKNFKLKDPGVPKQFEVIVTAEDGETQRIYLITVTRGQPSSDARLKGLSVSNVDEFTPVFVSSKNAYSAVVSIGAPGVNITPTANHPGATIRIDGNVVVSGQASELLEIIEVNQTVEIQVTAQDGVTTNIYTIDFTNENLINKTSNADLAMLAVEEGQMTPVFQAAVTEYEVATTEKTYSVDIIPKTADPLATMRVLSGTKEIGDYNGNYAHALVDGENQITIEVTSPDETVTKTYTVNIYRNEEGKLKNLTPLEAEDVDFENVSDPIIVMIDEYPRIGASVFNTLKTEYPEKTIVFVGNDYSVEFKASELERIVPQTEIFDFRMSFSSPDADSIYALMDAYDGNDDIYHKAVMVYFTYHGGLPGPATLYLGLGTKYGDQTLYWHYYNQERERIDYYGTLQSNQKGNVAVTIDHFSTYIVTPIHRIVGSEDKSGNIDASGGKTNPYTGQREEGR